MPSMQHMFDVDQVYCARNGVSCRVRSHSVLSCVDIEESMYVYKVNDGVGVVGIAGEITVSYDTCLILIYSY
jgi:hypothetical protein